MAQNNFVDFDQAKALANKIAQRLNEQSAGLIFKGSKTFATLPSTLTQAMAGYVYNMSESFTTDSRFVEGSGKTYPAGTNVAVADCSTYEAVVDPSGDPSSQDWYELVNNKYVLSTDTEVDPSKTYYVGTISMKFDVASGFIDVESINDRIDDVRDDVAEQFSTSGTYKAGDIVMHNDLLYKFKTDHSAGAWNSAEVDATNIASELSENQNVLTAGDYIEIDGNEISVNPVVPNENVTYEFKTKDTSSSDATVTLIKKSGDTVISSTDYRYESVMGNKYITVDDLFYFGYFTTFTSGSNWGYKLLAASADHAVDYTRSWGYNDTVDYTENFTSIDHSGENLVLKAQMDTALSGKQNTLTFDEVPTDGSNNPVKSNGVYDALIAKQDAFTSGDYLEMSNGVLNVTKNKGNDLYSYKFITTSTSDWPRVKIQRYINGVFQSEETYNNDDVRTNPVTLDGLFTFTYGVDGYRWQYTLLANSHQHNAGEVVKWMYNVSVDSTESFDVVPQDTSKNLVLQEDLDAAISSAYHHAGTKTCAELVAGLLVAGNEGNVYNMTDSGTTTADFIEGAGQPIKAGDNVGIAKISDGVYKFDLLSGFVDTTNFVQKSQTAGLLKNDGTVDTTIQGDVSTLKSGLTSLGLSVVNGKLCQTYSV